jgi:two-component system, LytTR family, sensor kinase
MYLLQKYWQLSFSNRYYRVAAHLLFWLFLLFLATRESVTIKVNLHQHIWVSCTGIALGVFLFYPLVYGIIPLLQKRKYLLGFFCFIVYYLIAIVLRTYHISVFINWSNLKTAWVSGQDFWDNVLHRQLAPYTLVNHFFSSITGLLNIIFIPLIIKFIRYAYQFNVNINRVEKEKAKQRLDFLKAQLNPHLLFNTLNNLQSLIVHHENRRSVDLLSNLSSFLRFSLYEASNEFIILDKEVMLIENYITIERFRYEESAIIRFIKNVSTGNVNIPPLLLLPMVENAFKHSGCLSSAQIDIQVNLQAGADEIQFSVYNKYVKGNTDQRDEENPGIGLDTLKKRLEYYYPGKHTLTMQDNSTEYQINLNIYFK